MACEHVDRCCMKRGNSMWHDRFRTMWLLALAFALMLVLAACGGDDEDTADDAEETDATEEDDSDDSADAAGDGELDEATVLIVPNTGTLAAMAAAENGYWIDHGVDVDLRIIESGSQIVQAVGAGEGDFGLTNAAAAGIPASRAGGLDLVAVVPALNNPFWISYMERATFIGLADSGIDPDDPETLRGKSIAIHEGTLLDTYVRSFLAEHGMGEDDVEFVNIPFTEVAVSLEQGLIDAGITYEPYGSQILREQGDAVVPISRGGPYSSDINIYASTEQYVDENPEIVEKVILGLLEGSQFARQDTEGAADILLRYLEGVEQEDVIEA
ncbi:MAG: hypothetical protein GEU78_14035, partial [Actinobacteria bacterium]|nr:hypothetical protein [Actinomycetota bacterium]